MRKVVASRRLITFYIGGLLVSRTQAAHGTTLVAWLRPNEIILAADTRSGTNDEYCKIATLGQVAVAVSGSLTYTKTVSTDPVPNWSALEDAAHAREEEGDSVRLIASAWAKRVASFYGIFEALAPWRVKQLADTNEQHVLITAFFVGWAEDIPLLLWEKIWLDESTPYTIRISEQNLPIRDLPYTTNAKTQELIEGTSAQAARSRAKWKASSLLIPDNELDWRQMEFFVSETSDHDPSVSSIADVLEVTDGSKASWLHNPTCKSGVAGGSGAAVPN